MATTDNYCLKWNEYESNISCGFRELRDENEFFDVTLCCNEGLDQVQAHKVVLASCSPFFKRILSRNPHSNPLLYLNGIDVENLNAILNFIYLGEVNIHQDDLSEFLRVAEELSIKGLTDGKKGLFNNHNNLTTNNIKTENSNYIPPGPASRKPPTLKRAPPSTVNQWNNKSANISSKKRKTLPSSLKVSEKIEVQPDLTPNHDENKDLEEVEAEMCEDYDYNDISEEILVEDNILDDSPIAMNSSQEISKTNNKSFTKTEDLSGNSASIDDYVMRNAQGTFWCKVCAHHSSSRRDLTRHIEAKHITGDYRCEFCNKCSTTKYGMQRHINKFHRDKSNSGWKMS